MPSPGSSSDGGLDAVFTAGPGRSTGALSLELDVIAAVVIGGAEPERRERQHPRFNDRRIDYGRAAKRFESDGLAHIRSGDHHRRRDYRSRGIGPLAPSEGLKDYFALAAFAASTNWRALAVSAGQSDFSRIAADTSDPPTPSATQPALKNSATLCTVHTACRNNPQMGQGSAQSF